MHFVDEVKLKHTDIPTQCRMSKNNINLIQFNNYGTCIYVSLTNQPARLARNRFLRPSRSTMAIPTNVKMKLLNAVMEASHMA